MDWLLNSIGKVAGFFGSGIVKVLGDSVLGPVLKTPQNGQNAQKDVAVSVIQAEMAANQTRAAIAPAFKGLIYGIGIPPAIHFGATCLSHTFDLGWPYFAKARAFRASAWASVMRRPGVTLIRPDAVVTPQPVVQTPTLSL